MLPNVDEASLLAQLSEILNMEVQASKNCNESELEYHQFQSSLQQIILVSLGFYFYDISDIAYDTSLDLIRKHLE